MRKDKPSPNGDRRKLRPRTEGGKVLASFVATPEQREQVRTLAGLQLRRQDIVTFIKWPNGEAISTDTLATHFANEIAEGEARVHLGLAKSILQRAKDGDMQAVMWVLARKFGWNETSVHATVGKDGEAAAIENAAAVTQVHYYLPKKNAPQVTDADLEADEAAEKGKTAAKPAAKRTRRAAP